MTITRPGLRRAAAASAMALLAAAALLPPTPALAQTEVQALARCLGDSTSGKDRKELARWFFIAMSAHPEIKPFASAAVAEAAPGSHQAVGSLFTRLMTEDCAAQTRAAHAQGGSGSIQVAFQTLGQLAMQELMSDPAVVASIGAFEKHFDGAKLERVLKGP